MYRARSCVDGFSMYDDVQLIFPNVLVNRATNEPVSNLVPASSQFARFSKVSTIRLSCRAVLKVYIRRDLDLGALRK